jgi:hypothetical protein
MAKKKSKSVWRMAAELVATDLMTNGAGQTAARVKMLGSDESDLGGRNFESVASTIEKNLEALMGMYEAGRNCAGKVSKTKPRR